jgi:hypothetical protein
MVSRPRSEAVLFRLIANCNFQSYPPYPRFISIITFSSFAQK